MSNLLIDPAHVRYVCISKVGGVLTGEMVLTAKIVDRERF